MLYYMLFASLWKRRMKTRMACTVVDTGPGDRDCNFSSNTCLSWTQFPNL